MWEQWEQGKNSFNFISKVFPQAFPPYRQCGNKKKEIEKMNPLLVKAIGSGVIALAVVTLFFGEKVKRTLAQNLRKKRLAQ